MSEDDEGGPGVGDARSWRWSNGPGDVYASHRHPYDKRLVAERGSIVFQLPEEGRAVELGAGEVLELRAGTLHEARVGPEGVSCRETHLPAGSLASRVGES